MTEPATSKELQTPPQYSHQRAKQQMVDLTIEDEEENMALTTGETIPKNQTYNRQTKKYKSLQIFLIDNILSQNKNIKTYITVGFHVHESTE